MKRRIPLTVLGIILLGGCDQSVNYTGLAETQLTGKYCSEKNEPERSCKAGDVVVTVEGREPQLCDWGWQIVHEPGSNEVLCVYRGSLRESRSP
jgi:hypothetical protein